MVSQVKSPFDCMCSSPPNVHEQLFCCVRRYGLEEHSNHHLGQGLDDNSLALTLQGLYLYRKLSVEVLDDEPASSAVTCSACDPITGCLGTNSSGDSPGENGRCGRYPDCKEVAVITPHLRSTNLRCPHHPRHNISFRIFGDEW